MLYKLIFYHIDKQISRYWPPSVTQISESKKIVKIFFRKIQFFFEKFNFFHFLHKKSWLTNASKILVPDEVVQNLQHIIF